MDGDRVDVGQRRVDLGGGDEPVERRGVHDAAAEPHRHLVLSDGSGGEQPPALDGRGTHLHPWVDPHVFGR